MTTEELEIWKRLNECEAVKKVFVGWEVGDRFAFGEKIQIVTGDSLNQHRRQAVWIPPLFDQIRPERSLMGIANRLGVNADRVDLFTTGTTCRLDELRFANRPDLALAEAIIEQEEK